MAWYDPTSWDFSGMFGGSSSTPDDASLSALINATDLANIGAGTDYNQFSGFSALPSFYDQYYNTQPETSTFDSWKDPLSLGLGALGGLGNLWAYYDKQKALEDALKDQTKLKERELAQQAALQREQRRLGAGDDFSKMHALAQILQQRQGINLDPSLAYAEAVRKEMGLSPASATAFTGDVGGPMRIQAQTAAKQAALQQALGQPVQYTAQFAGGGYYAGGGPNRGGALGLLRGGTGGQDDSINASISDGEYVMDAETVSMLGDGNTEAGAAKLDEMRQNLRSHKRSASPKKIAPKAKGALSYLKGK